MARLPKKKRTRAETIQDLKTQTASAKILGKEIPAGIDTTPSAYKNVAATLAAKFDSHMLVWPNDAIRIGGLLADLFTRVLAPEAVRVHRDRYPQEGHLGDAFYGIEKLAEIYAFAQLKKKFLQLLGRIARGGSDAWKELEGYIADLRIIAPLTGKVYDSDYVIINKRARSLFIPAVILISRVLVRSSRHHRIFRDHVRHRVGLVDYELDQLNKLIDKLKPLK